MEPIRPRPQPTAQSATNTNQGLLALWTQLQAQQAHLTCLEKSESPLQSFQMELSTIRHNWERGEHSPDWDTPLLSPDQFPAINEALAEMSAALQEALVAMAKMTEPVAEAIAKVATQLDHAAWEFAAAEGGFRRGEPAPHTGKEGRQLRFLAQRAAVDSSDGLSVVIVGPMLKQDGALGTRTGLWVLPVLS